MNSINDVHIVRIAHIHTNKNSQWTQASTFIHLESQWSFDWLHIYVVYSFYVWISRFNRFTKRKRDVSRGEQEWRHLIQALLINASILYCVADVCVVFCFFFFFPTRYFLGFIRLQSRTPSEMECQKRVKDGIKNISPI